MGHAAVCGQEVSPELDLKTPGVVRRGLIAGCAARTHGPQTSVGADPAAQPLFPSTGSSIRLVVSGPSVCVLIPKHEHPVEKNGSPRKAIAPFSTRGNDASQSASEEVAPPEVSGTRAKRERRLGAWERDDVAVLSRFVPAVGFRAAFGPGLGQWRASLAM